jgi:CheY-like chemotaxis protein
VRGGDRRGRGPEPARAARAPPPLARLFSATSGERLTDGRTILVVDDDTDLRETIGELLVEEGYDARLYENGRAALESLRSGELEPKLILLDLMMPEMNGWQFREEQLRDERLRDIPVVVMTASRGLEANPITAQEVLLKPLGLGELVDAIARNVR